MNIAPVDPPHLKEAELTQGALVTAAGRWLFITGQAPYTADGTVPEGFETQCRLVWRKVLSVLDEAGMSVENLVKVTTYLSDRQDREANAKIRQEVLGSHRPSLGIIITGCWDEAWLLEIEAVAAA
jgi:2-iminobutanoate/2-iminopropanoate deaminase